jgi:ATP/maltotriose-dependent transcriptional regulator MalT
MAYCWICALTGKIDGISSHLSDVRAELANLKDAQQPNRLAVISSLAETIEAIIALDSGQARCAKDHATRAISLIPKASSPAVRGLLHGAAGYRLAEAHKALGEFDQSSAVLLDVLEMLKTGENPFGVAATSVQIVTAYRHSGKTREAIALCHDTLGYFKTRQWQNMPSSGIIYLVLANLEADFGQLDAARHHLGVGRKLVEPMTSQQMLDLADKVSGKLTKHTSQSQPLVEPLSVRELEVLKLIAHGLSNREISERLFVALDTVKGHNRNIFGKMGVRNRAQAVSKAISLGILPSQQPGAA